MELITNGDFKIVEMPGFLGFRKKDVYTSWNQKYGENNWQLLHRWKDELIPQRDTIALYEDAYYEFFRGDKDQLEWVLRNFGDVYDMSLSDIESGYDYSIQKGNATHLHDIAIRRVLSLRMGKNFEGKELLQVRQPTTKGYHLGPGIVPFHMPELIEKSEGIINYGLDENWEKKVGTRNPWWDKDSIEDFYQSNRVLIARS